MSHAGKKKETKKKQITNPKKVISEGLILLKDKQLREAKIQNSYVPPPTPPRHTSSNFPKIDFGWYLFHRVSKLNLKFLI